MIFLFFSRDEIVFSIFLSSFAEFTFGITIPSIPFCTISLRSASAKPDSGEFVLTKTSGEYFFLCLSVFYINVLAFFFSLSGTESSRSKHTISAGSDFAFSKNLELFPGTKTRLRNRYAFND